MQPTCQLGGAGGSDAVDAHAELLAHDTSVHEQRRERERRVHSAAAREAPAVEATEVLAGGVAGWYRCRAAAAGRTWPLLRWRLVTPRAVKGCEQQDEGSQGPQLQPKLHWLRFSRRRLAEQYREHTEGMRSRHSLRAETARQLQGVAEGTSGAVRPHASG